MESIEKELAEIRSPDNVLKLLGWTVTKCWTKSLLIAGLFNEIWKHGYHALKISYSHRFTSSCFGVLKKLSIMAFSYGLPMHAMLTRKPWFLSAPTYSFEAYCTPRTEWWMTVSQTSFVLSPFWAPPASKRYPDWRRQRSQSSYGSKHPEMAAR